MSSPPAQRQRTERAEDYFSRLDDDLLSNVLSFLEASEIARSETHVARMWHLLSASRLTIYVPTLRAYFGDKWRRMRGKKLRILAHIVNKLAKKKAFLFEGYTILRFTR